MVRPTGTGDGTDQVRRLARSWAQAVDADVAAREAARIIAVGTVLPNGGFVVDVRSSDRWGGAGIVVLAVWRGEYVTWMADRTAPDSTVWGHYFDTLAEAMANLEERAS